MLSRRQFVLASAAFAAGGTIGCRLGRSQPAPFDTPLPLPQLIDAAGQGNAVTLRAAAGQHAFVAGMPAATCGYSAPVLGPVIRLRRGEQVEMTVENALDIDTTVHWHGLLLPSSADGGPHQIIKPGDTWRPVLEIAQPAATAWFHPHLHRDTGRQVYMGLAGMIIIDDGTDARLDLPRTYGVDDLPIILQDRSFDSDGSLVYELDSLQIIYGGRGDTIIVNGAIAPFAKVPSGLVRLRLLNAANAQNFQLRFSDRRKFHVIASDSGFLSRPVEVAELRISPAERFEILVDFADGRPVVLETGPDEVMGIFGAVSPFGPNDHVPLMRFEPTAAGSRRGASPRSWSSRPPQTRAKRLPAGNSCWRTGPARATGRSGPTPMRSTRYASTARSMTSRASTLGPGSGRSRRGRSSRSGQPIRSTYMARRFASCRSRARRHPSISQVGRTSFWSRRRPSSWSRSTTRPPRSVPSCITVTSSSMPMPG
jgi:FtsP/CotA-like multicopper oxidase with cupredoxin domain